MQTSEIKFYVRWTHVGRIDTELMPKNCPAISKTGSSEYSLYSMTSRIQCSCQRVQGSIGECTDIMEPKTDGRIWP